MAIGKIPCALPDPVPDMHIHGECVSGGCGNFDGSLQWDEKNKGWTNQDGSFLYWSEQEQGYVWLGPKGGNGNQLIGSRGTFRCTPDMKIVYLGVGPDEKGCYYDITFSPEKV
jgi:hypothetical protein